MRKVCHSIPRLNILIKQTNSNLFITKSISGIDTIRSYLVVATKTMNEQGRTALKEVKALKSQIAAAEVQINEKESLILELENSAIGEHINESTDSLALTSQQAPPLCERGRQMLGKLHKMLLASTESIADIRSSDTAGQATSKRGKAGGNSRAGAAKAAELELVTKYCNLLSKVESNDAHKQQRNIELTTLNKMIIQSDKGKSTDFEDATLESSAKACSSLRHSLLYCHGAAEAVRTFIDTCSPYTDDDTIMTAIAEAAKPFYDRSGESPQNGYAQFLRLLTRDRILRQARLGVKCVLPAKLFLLSRKSKPPPDHLHLVLQTCLALERGLIPTSDVAELDWATCRDELRQQSSSLVNFIMLCDPTNLQENQIEALHPIYVLLLKLNETEIDQSDDPLLSSIIPFCDWLLATRNCLAMPLEENLIPNGWPPDTPETVYMASSLARQVDESSSAPQIAESIIGNLMLIILSIRKREEERIGDCLQPHPPKSRKSSRRQK